MSDSTPKPTCKCCLKPYDGYPALSRYDNKTLICPDCGLVEAFNGPLIHMCRAVGMRWPSYAGRVRTLGYQSPLALAVMEANKEYTRLVKEGKINPFPDSPPK